MKSKKRFTAVLSVLLLMSTFLGSIPVQAADYQDSKSGYVGGSQAKGTLTVPESRASVTAKTSHGLDSYKIAQVSGTIYLSGNIVASYNSPEAFSNTTAPISVTVTCPGTAIIRTAVGYHLAVYSSGSWEDNTHIYLY